MDINDWKDRLTWLADYIDISLQRIPALPGTAGSEFIDLKARMRLAVDSDDESQERGLVLEFHQLVMDSGHPIGVPWFQIRLWIESVFEKFDENPQLRETVGDTAIRQHPKEERLHSNFNHHMEVLTGHNDSPLSIRIPLACGAIVVAWELLSKALRDSIGIRKPWNDERKNRESGSPRLDDRTWNDLDELNRSWKNFVSLANLTLGPSLPYPLDDLRHKWVHGEARLVDQGLELDDGGEASFEDLIGLLLNARYVWEAWQIQIIYGDATYDGA